MFIRLVGIAALCCVAIASPGENVRRWNLEAGKLAVAFDRTGEAYNNLVLANNALAEALKHSKPRTIDVAAVALRVEVRDAARKLHEQSERLEKQAGKVVRISKGLPPPY